MTTMIRKERSHHNAVVVNIRYIFASILWMVFLLLQINLFDQQAEHYHNDSYERTTLGQGIAGAVGTNPSHRPKRSNKRRSPGVAALNNIDVYYRPPFNSLNIDNKHFWADPVNCVGRDFVNDAELRSNYSWMFRSCRFRNLCLDTQTSELVIVARTEQPPLPIAMGAINPRWFGRGFNMNATKIQWTPPTIPLHRLMETGYYELPDDVVLLPFHSMAAHNVGHLLWDDLYPIFTLLKWFGYIRNQRHSVGVGKNDNDHTNGVETSSDSAAAYQFLLLRWTNAKQKLYATCEMQKKKSQQCTANLVRFLPLLGVDPVTFSTIGQAQLKSPIALKSQYVCAKHSVAGLGMLMDHGMMDHGWVLRDPNSGLGMIPHNIGRGGLFREFREFMMGNMGFPSSMEHAPTKIIFSTYSSRGFERSLGFQNQSAALLRTLSNYDNKNNLQIQRVTMRDLSLQDQMQVAMESAVFITVCGGGAITATFLPEGSTLIIYYPEDGGFDFWKYNYTYTPARLDWDLLGNAAHLRVHWLPMKSMESHKGIQLLEELVSHELEVMDLLGRELDSS